jgi:hypothetical protein
VARLHNALPDTAAVLGRLMAGKEEQESAHSALEGMWKVGGCWACCSLLCAGCVCVCGGVALQGLPAE